MDGGLPESWKDLERVEFSSEGDQASLTISVQTDPTGTQASIPLNTVGQGADWAPDVGSGSNDLEWDVGDWALDVPSTAVSGVQAGTIAKRYKFTASSVPTGDLRISSFEATAVLLPDMEYNT